MTCKKLFYRVILCFAVVMSGSATIAGQKVMVGGLSTEAKDHQAEWREYGYRKTLVKDGMDGGLVEGVALYSGGQPGYHGALLKEDAFYESLKPFNVISFGSSSEGVYSFDEERQKNCAAARRALERYVSEGGGLFFLLHPERYPNSADEKYYNAMMAGFGVSFLHEGVWDPQHAFISPPKAIIGSRDYFYTGNVTPHPVTKGVARLYLPKLNFTGQPGVPAFKLTGPWKIVVAGEETAKSFAQGAIDNNMDITRPGFYSSAPPIAAVREFGKGRVFVWAVPGYHVFDNFGNRLWDDITETEGDAEGGKPSSGNRLALNALKWLGEPSLDIPGFGTYRDVPPKPVTFPGSINLDKYDFDPLPAGVEPDKYEDDQPIAAFSAPEAGVRGVIGAHTSLTDGQGSVADYVAAARAAGLKFIVFTEPLELLTAEKLAQLKADCATASKDPDFYACPGVEFTDILGNRWAAWGEKVIYPPDTFEYKNRKYTLWDGKRIWLTGHYEFLCGLPPNALIDYKTLEKAPADRSNMWWFFRIIPFAYDGQKLIADNFDQWLFALRDLRWMDTASFTRIRSPQEVASASATCVTAVRDVEQARKWLNTRCSSYNHAARPYVSQGPQILFWEGMNIQMECPVAETRGAQRIRMKFMVASADGIREVKVHDADFGVVRRFLGRGAKELTREFEMVQDKQHFLTLEVTDTRGRRAVSRYILIFCYKSGLHRCGDNLNMLGSAAITWHPDRDEMTLTKNIEDSDLNTLGGFDTDRGIVPQPTLWAEEGVWVSSKPNIYPACDGSRVNKILDVDLTSHNLQIFTWHMKYLTQGYDNEQRPGPAHCSITRRLGELDLFERTHTCYVLSSRMNYYVKYNHRRKHEGAKDYRGGIVWHEGHIRFKKDVTLKSRVPVPLLCMDGPGGAPARQFDHLFVTDRDRGVLGIALLPQDKIHNINGRIQPGGYLAAMPTDAGYYAFFSSSDGDFAYDSQDWNNDLAKFGRIYIGLGQEDQEIKAGTVLPYRFMMASLNDRRVSNELLEDMRRAYNLDGGRAGYPLKVKHGALVNAEFFLTLKADGNEALFDAGPREMICDLPIRVQDLEDNGCAALYSDRDKFFRFISVVGATAYLQAPIDKADTFWIGNVFVAENKAVKLTLVCLGQSPDKEPFLEAHNPTDKPVKTVITSPAHAPVFGGFRQTVEIPAGDSIRLTDLKKK